MDQVLDGAAGKPIHALLQDYPWDSNAGDSPLNVKGMVFKRDNSEIFYAECDAYPTPVAIKICLQPHTDKLDLEAAQEQFDALKKVSDAMAGKGRFRVPKPYLVQKNAGVVIMEWINAPAMTDILLRSDCSVEQAKVLLCEAADWLRNFHQANSLPDTFLDTAEKTSDLDNLNKSSLASNPVFSEALKVLATTAKSASEIAIPQSWIHGDFKTDNLLVSNTEIIGIDVHVRHINSVFYDIAPFLNHFELSCYHPKVWRLGFAKQVLVKTFLDRYLGDKSKLMSLPLLWVRIYSLLSVWAMVDSRNRSWLRQTFLDFSFQHLLQKLLVEVQRHKI